MAKPKLHTIRLDEYEIANLRSALIFAQALGADSGDWFAQVLHKLPEVEHRPNKTPQDFLTELRQGIAGGYLLPRNTWMNDSANERTAAYANPAHMRIRAAGSARRRKPK